MTTDPDALINRCKNLHIGSAEAISWIDDARNKSERLDRESDELIRGFRRLRNQTNRLGKAAARPMSVGFFGLSQAGKSYLISSLAANAAGELETEMDGARLNFISHINPPGGGKEATGLVTRFTRKPCETPNNFPIKLTLFSETDIVKILGNSFFNDFDTQKVSFNFDAVYIRQLLDELDKQCGNAPTGGITEDDVVDLMDYFIDRFGKSMEPLITDYWPTAIEIAPRLPVHARARLFSVLWGEIDIMTDVYTRLRNALESIRYAPVVCASVDALVRPIAEGGYSQTDSIMNVDILERLGKDDSDTVRVIPFNDEDQPTAEANLPRSMLAALTSEMIFSLADEPKAKTINTVDLLDFPGYRGRLDVGSVDEIAKIVENEDANPVAELYLRGKVAYLFEQYTENQEMNVLVLCTPCNEQINVTSLGPVLQSWIHSTQGETPEIRNTRDPGLIWCITKFDYKLSPRPGETLDNIRMEWAGMLKAALLERFGKYQWLQEWAPGQCFNNLFLVRKPRMAPAVIETGETETGIKPDQEQRLTDMRKVFAEEESVCKHFVDPAEAWDAMMALNDGGMQYLADYLEKVAHRHIKLDRISEQIERLAAPVIEHYLGSYYQDGGEAEIENKKKIANSSLNALMKIPDRLGELLNTFQPTSEHLRAIYLKAESDNEDEEGEDEKASVFSGSSLIDLPVESDAQDNTPKADRASNFARAAMSYWISQLRRLIQDQGLKQYIGLDEDTFQSIIDELITGAYMYKLEEHLIEALQDGELQTSATRIDIADRQVLVTKRIFGLFLEMLGQDILPEDEKAKSDPSTGQKGTVFTPPPSIPVGTLPDIAPKPVPFSAIAILDWLRAFESMVINNAGQSAGREITIEQNEQLGLILNRFKETSSTEKN